MTVVFEVVMMAAARSLSGVEVGPDSPLAPLGLESLLVVVLARKITDATGTEVSSTSY
jgi:hypothetical protein